MAFSRESKGAAVIRATPGGRMSGFHPRSSGKEVFCNPTPSVEERASQADAPPHRAQPQARLASVRPRRTVGCARITAPHPARSRRRVDLRRICRREPGSALHHRPLAAGHNRHCGSHFDLSLEPVSDVRGGTDVEDTLTPSNYYATQDPLPTAHWTFAGFNSSPFETAVLIVVYDGGSIATLPPSSRQLQISLLFYNGTRIALPSIGVVPVPEPCGLLLATASAVVLRRLRRPRGRRVTAAPSDPAALLQ